MNIRKHNYNRAGNDCFCSALELVLHDMQQPLHAARVRIETLMLRLDREEWLVSPAATRREMEPVRAALQDMKALMESVRDVMRAEAGADLSAQAEAADLRELLNQAIQPFRERAARTSVRLSLTAEPPLPEVHWLQRQMRCHVLNNLLANALQVSPPGAWIEVSARALGKLVEIRVSDEGPGIAPDQRSKVFERHQSGSGDPGDGHRGMGLYSARLFTRLHQGELYAEDGTGGRGATLVLRLPANPFGAELDSAPGKARAANEPTQRPAGLAFQTV